VPEIARNLSLEPAALAQRLAKTGGTPYRCIEVRAQVEPGLSLSASAINAMRRDVLNQLTALRARREEHPIRKPKPVPMYKGEKDLPGLTVQVTTKEQLTPSLLNMETAMLYVPMHILMEDQKMTARLVQRGRLAVALPRIIHDGEMPRIIAQLTDLRDMGLKDVLVGNLGHMISVRELGLRIPAENFRKLAVYGEPGRIAAYRDGSIWRMVIVVFGLEFSEMPDMVISSESKELRFFSKEELKDIEIVITHSDIVEDWFTNR
jgi:hypothetical protein